ncbi:Hypothetical protein A7982_05857 [Minicystis rosea]|nr:Hypothetical protein A7982_05857 [Minicystis rosea]
MDLADLERAFSTTKTQPLFVDARLVRRVIKRHRRLPGFGLQVPHARCYWIDRAALLDIVTPAELGRSVAEIPDEVVLLPRPDADELADMPAPELLTQLWRQAFHARVHLELERGDKLPPAVLRERVHRIGQTEIDEIRLVLRQDDLLLPPREDLDTYAELAALYLELRHFAPELLHETFPALDDHAMIDAVLAEDVDVARILEACRPEGAPERPRLASLSVEHTPLPEPPPDPKGAADKAPGTLRGEADEARRRGNLVRSALSRLRLATAGGPEAEGAVAEAHVDLAALARRLDEALRPAEGGSAIDVKAWEAVLFALADRAAHRAILRWVEARLLFDLQRACLASEKAIGKADLVDWALSFGKRPLARLLPATRPIRVAHELASAAKKVARVGITETERARLGALLATARRRADDNIRAALRPVVVDALREVGMRPESVPERVAMHKIIEDLLDQATTRGHLGLGQLRDAISKNQLKLPDLSGPRELYAGDALLLADKRLGVALDGVHGRGEIYLRFLQKVSSLLFGTRLGRFLTLYFLLPVSAAYVLLEGAGHMATPIGRLLKILPRHHHVHLLTRPSFAVTAVILFGLIHSAAVRNFVRNAARAVGYTIAAIFFHAPRWLLTRPAVRRALESRAFLAVRRYLLKPLAIAAAVVIASPLRRAPSLETIVVATSIFLFTNVVLNSRTGALLEELAYDEAARTWRLLRRHVLPGLVRLIADTFRSITEAIDRGIYAVDEWLRFREGQSRPALYAKAVLGVVWFAVAYLARIYINLLIEPQINPIKHFPVVTVAAKIMLPLSPTLIPALHDVLARPFGSLVASTIAAPTVLLLPGVAGFLVWEFKENYKLYRATRATKLEPVAIGHHGETMGALLKPGLHSGTVPKLWAKLRRAVRRGDAAAEKHHEAMRELSEAVERFVEREMLALLEASPAWKAGPIRVRRVELASNRVRVLLERGEGREEHRSEHGTRDREDDAGTVAIAFEEQSGFVVACVPRLGWVVTLSAAERLLFENALGGLYQLAGVDLVREQIEATLPGSPPYDVCDEGLVVWPGGSYRTEIVYPLDGAGDLVPTVRGEPLPAEPPALDRKRIVFREQPIAWDAWVAAWSAEAPPRVVKGDPLLPEAPAASVRSRAIV